MNSELTSYQLEYQKTWEESGAKEIVWKYDGATYWIFCASINGGKFSIMIPVMDLWKSKETGRIHAEDDNLRLFNIRQQKAFEVTK